MKRKSQFLLLVAMCVLLLVVVSSRVAPGNSAANMSVPVDEGPVSVTVTLPPVTPTVPVYEPQEPVPVREELPNINLNDWNMRLVNNTYILPSSFAPNVEMIRNGQYFDARAAEALENMIAAAEENGYTVSVRAAYRPFSTQAYLFNGRASQIQWGTSMTLLEAETEARKVVAYPGTSEHQLGLSADLMDSEQTSLNAETAEGLPLLQWLQSHCAEYGFILRYPKEKKDITGWYEPWHFRYVGVEAAEYIMENGLCLEEFIELY